MSLTEALNRLVRLYTLLDKKEKADEGRKKKIATTDEKTGISQKRVP